jgi:hypothetical protein
MSNWRALHQAVVTETDVRVLEPLVYETETAIFLRLQELEPQCDHEDELCDLRAAADDLLAVKTQKLGWPDPLAEDGPSSNTRHS